MPALRGGGEYGTKWHHDGSMLRKQNVFDDFISAAEYLVKEKFTSSSKMAAMGGSNGGLLVGAVINQRPELFKVAIARVGVYDMLKYHKFTIGYSSANEFGTSEDSVQFRYLLGYSPLHNVKAGTNYPAVLIMTSDHDDRAVPLHSYKFTATLQEKSLGKNPVYLYCSENQGHSGQDLKSESLLYTFMYDMMDIDPLSILNY